MSESNVTTAVHQFVAGMKVKDPGTKFDYPPAQMGILDAHSEYFATNAMLAPVIFSAIGVLKSKLRASAVNAEDLEEFGGIDAFNKDAENRSVEGTEGDHAFEIGFEVAERSTIETVKFAYSLRKQQVQTGFKMYGRDNPYPPYSMTQALDFLIEAEPRDTFPQLKSAVATQLDSELESLGIDLEELHSRERNITMKREAANKETTRALRNDIIAAFKEAGTVDVVQGWQHLPTLLQYKCVIKALDSLMQATSRKSAMVKGNPRHPNKAQMENELQPLAEVIHNLKLDCHAVYRANRALFDEAFANGLAELPEVKPLKSAV